jgi:hypothetical protein
MKLNNWQWILQIHKITKESEISRSKNMMQKEYKNNIAIYCRFHDILAKTQEV